MKETVITEYLLTGEKICFWFHLICTKIFVSFNITYNEYGTLSSAILTVSLALKLMPAECID